MSDTPTSHTLFGVMSRLRAGIKAADDRELAARLDQAFAKHVPALQRQAARELSGFSQQQVEEAVQDALVDAWRSIDEGRYRPEKPLKAYLRGIVRHRCSVIRRKCRDVLTEDGVLDPGDAARTALETLQDDERNRLVVEALGAVLDRDEQEIAFLRWVEDHSLEEIAARLDLPGRDTVRGRLYRCKQRVAEQVRRLLEERGLGDSFLRDSSAG